MSTRAVYTFKDLKMENQIECTCGNCDSDAKMMCYECHLITMTDEEWVEWL